MTKWNGLNRTKPPRKVSGKTRIRNFHWKLIVTERALYLQEKYGQMICEYSGETIRTLCSTGEDMNDGWGHHIDRRRANCVPDNCYIVKYRYHHLIHDRNIKVAQEDFQGRTQ